LLWLGDFFDIAFLLLNNRLQYHHDQREQVLYRKEARFLQGKFAMDSYR
jgi:hypothetical protein